MQKTVSPSRTAPYIFGMSVLPYAVLIVAYPTSHLWLPDDAFYYLEIASNIGQGAGSTFDGINLTNGYHPLWQLLLGLVAVVIQSRWGLVVTAVLIQCALVCYSWTVLYRLLFPRGDQGTLILAGVVAVGLTWNYYAAKTVINGLESALYLATSVTLLARFARSCTDDGETVASAAWMGILASLVILSRLDGVFYVAGVALTWVVFRWSNVRRGKLHLFVFCLIPAVVLVVYMTVNQQVFGLWMPVSGYIKRFVLPTGPTTTTMFAFCALFGATLLATRISLGAWPVRLREARAAAVVTLSAVILIYQADAWLVRGRLVPEIWYLAQHLLWAFMLSVLVAHRVLVVDQRWIRRSVTVAFVAAAALGIVATWGIRLQRVSYDHAVAVREAAEWINEHLPQDAVIGSWDCGILGFYADPPVVNLDGLVNSANYLQHLQRGTTLDFMDKGGMRYVAQYYKDGFVRRGLDETEYWKRVSDVIWARTVTFAPMSIFIKTGMRKSLSYPYEIRTYQPATH